jgi:hypothetical protein
MILSLQTNKKSGDGGFAKRTPWALCAKIVNRERGIKNREGEG